MNAERWRWLRYGAAPLMAIVGAGASVAYACSVVPPPTPRVGVLGLDVDFSISPVDGGVAQVRVPRNVAFFGAVQALLDNFTVVETVDLNLPFAAGFGQFTTARDLLPPGGLLQANGQSVEVDDFVDTEAPAVPVIARGSLHFSDEDDSGCAQTSCGDLTTLQLTLESPADNHTPAQHLVYAVYVATSGREAATMQFPTQLLMAQGDGLFMLSDSGFREHNVFVSLEVLDFAGNLSERSLPVLVHRADGACAVGSIWRGRVSTWLWMVASVMLLGWRRRHRVSSASAHG